MSLRKKLKKHLKAKGKLSWNQMAKICRRNGNRAETGRRNLEPDKIANSRKIYNDKNHIVGWYWEKEENQENLV